MVAAVKVSVAADPLLLVKMMLFPLSLVLPKALET